uniref:Uncharacterized protein n=1 Tax=viral metagenome TaxID=1070528 RepID=A0A6M3KYQ0_9ZZZZ
MLDLDNLFRYGARKVVLVPNRLKKGHLKKSSFGSSSIWASTRRPQGDREKARRLRQREKGIIQ